MSSIGEILKAIFYLVLVLLVVLLVWCIWRGYIAARETAQTAWSSWISGLKGALDPTKPTFFIWQLPVISWTQPLSQGIADKLKGWFGVPTGSPGGSANPMNQTTTGEQAVALNPNFPPSITAQVTPLLAQPDPVQQPPTQNTGTDGQGQSIPVDNVVPFTLASGA